MSNDSFNEPIVQTPPATPWRAIFLKLVGWLILVVGLAGAAASYYYMNIITFSPTVIIDPFGIIAFLLSLALAALGFPLLLTLSYLVKEIAAIRRSIEMKSK